MVLDTDHLELTRKLRLVAVKKNVSRFKNCAQWGRSIPDVINFSDDVAIRRRGMNGGKRRKRYFRRNIFRFALKMEEKENGRNVDAIKVNYRGIFPSKVIVVDSKSFRLEHCVELFPLFLPPPKQINVIFSFEEKKVEWGGGGGEYLKIRTDVN